VQSSSCFDGVLMGWLSKYDLDKNKNKKIACVYLLKIASITLRIAPTTTIHPAMIVIIDGIAGIASVPSIMPEPTASDTMTPTIHVNIPIKFPSFILITSF
jgi:hypothetical protein